MTPSPPAPGMPTLLDSTCSLPCCATNLSASPLSASRSRTFALADVDDDVRAFAGQQFCARPTHAGRAGGDECDLALEKHCLLLSLRDRSMDGDPDGSGDCGRTSPAVADSL